MGKAIECIYENHVLKPLGRVSLKEGERIRVTIEKKLAFEPIRLKKKPVSEHIRTLRDDAWNSS
jgi:predicted DNA-binding antitoxin AbrB/MazE fold protein